MAIRKKCLHPIWATAILGWMSESTRVQHPAWQLYDFWRDARLDIVYYSHLQAKYASWATVFDIVGAVSAPTGAVAALPIWKLPLLQPVWIVLLTIAALVSVVKPLLKLAATASKLENVVTLYKVEEADAKKIIHKMIQKGSYDEALMNEFNEVFSRTADIMKQIPNLRESKRLIQQCHDDVIREFTGYEYFIPEG